MDNFSSILSYLSQKSSNVSIQCFTILAIFLGITTSANAATITFDEDKFSGDNPNTCSPKLSPSTAECFEQDNVNVEAFSVQDIGTPSPSFSPTGHFHESDSNESQHFIGENGLLGTYYTLSNGGKFNLESLDYQLRNIESGVITNFPTNDIKILLSTTFDPTQPVLSQFTEISLGNDINLPFQTLFPSGFENITQLYISSSAGVNFDNIVLTPVPEPASILGLLTLGSLGLFSRLKSKL